MKNACRLYQEPSKMGDSHDPSGCVVGIVYRRRIHATVCVYVCVFACVCVSLCGFSMVRVSHVRRFGACSPLRRMYRSDDASGFVVPLSPQQCPFVLLSRRRRRNSLY